VKGVRECCMSNSMERTNYNSCGMAVQRMGMSGVKAREMIWHAVCIKCMQLIVKYFS
jgi:hypothetical protein